ncbi:hypothetical protein N0P70_005415 [Klebsiella michiganensis]
MTFWEFANINPALAFVMCLMAYKAVEIMASAIKAAASKKKSPRG